ncbi:hypothetical protein RE428_24360 [Marinobacter nanhaiticus D15-8W]|uniref:Uncharacterized protein n=1 Tax=Marinobacter nanhaiticus D15-8W TaxID=626887 RepID=N6WZ39_9GAMM|nr:hypothetical protein J057_21630 [Marinobacter nanhaiticus D15-8W]BES71418.1 hypothetical protein RE428_24360 [Marinobacter nanhaiticus D15-8W]
MEHEKHTDTSGFMDPPEHEDLLMSRRHLIALGLGAVAASTVPSSVTAELESGQGNANVTTTYLWEYAYAYE